VPTEVKVYGCISQQRYWDVSAEQLAGSGRLVLDHLSAWTRPLVICEKPMFFPNSGKNPAPNSMLIAEPAGESR